MNFNIDFSYARLSSKNYSPTKILETERLILREVVETDAAFILDLLNSPSFIKYIGDRNVRVVDEARDYIKTRFIKSYRDFGYGLYAVEVKEKKISVGICGFVKRDSLPDADIGFAFLPQFERKGYGVESASAVMEYGRNSLSLKRILAITTPHNESSIRLLEKLNFKFEGLVKLSRDADEVKLFSFE